MDRRGGVDKAWPTGALIRVSISRRAVELLLDSVLSGPSGREARSCFNTSGLGSMGDIERCSADV